MSRCCHTAQLTWYWRPALISGMEQISIPSQAQTGARIVTHDPYLRQSFHLHSSFFASLATSRVTERRFWISTSEPVCQVIAQRSPTNPCRCLCLASWMESVWSWLPVLACLLEWSCPPPLPSNTAHAETAGVQMVLPNYTNCKKISAQ